MVAKYYVAIRPQTNKHHAVHKEDCPFLPDDGKRIYLGVFNSDQDALGEGKRYFSRTKCCLFCSPDNQHDLKKKKFARTLETGCTEMKKLRSAKIQSAIGLILSSRLQKN
jgi:hypothetical protein